MTPVSVTLVQDSFRKVAPVAGVVADLFHDRLFTTAPELRALFPAAPREQKTKLVQMLVIAVNGLGDLDMILPALEDLGRRHRSNGVGAAHHGAVGSALLHALREALGDDFTPDVEAAWAEAYSLLSHIMLTGQDRMAA